MKKLLRNYIKWGWCILPASSGESFDSCIKQWREWVPLFFFFGLVIHTLAFLLLVLAWHNPIPSLIIGLIIWKTISYWEDITSCISKFINWLTEDED